MFVHAIYIFVQLAFCISISEEMVSLNVIIRVPSMYMRIFYIPTNIE